MTLVMAALRTIVMELTLLRAMQVPMIHAHTIVLSAGSVPPTYVMRTTPDVRMMLLTTVDMITHHAKDRVVSMYAMENILIIAIVTTTI
ncbi:MAG: hypothetical protein DRN95_09360 [Candidatus Hydrothermarchaeota archaeon]|nr:MAG: hypothetical protein DRN95_09360 [Candidatus Hydrothermarchaeota archaeon]